MRSLVRHLDGRAILADEVQLPFHCIAVTEGIHLRKFLAGIDMHRGKRHMAEEGLAGEPDNDIAVLAHGPEHGQAIDAVEGFAQDVDALGFELIEMGHHGILSFRL